MHSVRVPIPARRVFGGEFACDTEAGSLEVFLLTVQ